MTDILIIEHDLTQAQFLVQALESQGYEVTTARTGQEGLNLADQLHPGVIICDWSMPGDIDGLTICRTLKHHPVLSTSALLLLTSRYSTADRLKGLEMGADDLLSTPVDINELNARVRAGLRLYQLTQDLRAQKHLMEAELAEAEAYVRSLLPQDINGRVPIHSQFIPSRQLGGDCFDYYWLDPDYLVMYLLDVSGHGLGSALLSTSVLNVLRSQSLPNTSFYRPENVLRALNETFQMSEQNQKYFTIWYGVLNCANRQLMYASAGHPPAIVVSMEDGQTVSTARLRTAGLPIGMMPEAKYQWQRQQLPPNSTIYLFSDGLYEVLQANQEYIGLDAFVEVLAAGKRQTKPAEIVDTIIQRRAGESAADDMSLVAVQVD